MTVNDIDYKVGDWVVLIPEMWEGINPQAYNMKFDTPYHVKFISGAFGGGYKSIELFGVNGRYDSWYFKKANSVIPADEKFPDFEYKVKGFYDRNMKLINEFADKVKSDGGSSSYYDIELPDELLKLLNQRNRDGKAFIKVEEIIELQFGNHFDFGTAFKALHRGYLATQGKGKEGNTVEYDMNKVLYSANKIKAKHKE